MNVCMYERKDIVILLIDTVYTLDGRGSIHKEVEIVNNIRNYRYEGAW